MSVFVLKPENARARMAAAWAEACSILQLGHSVRLELEELQPTRTLEQNAKFHAICGDIAKQKDWAGQKLDVEGWKRLLVDAWARHEHQDQIKVVPSLDGKSVVHLGIQTRRMRIGEMSELIEFALHYAVDNDVVLGDNYRGETTHV